jgi:hypothetical protein
MENKGETQFSLRTTKSIPAIKKSDPRPMTYMLFLRESE